MSPIEALAIAGSGIAAGIVNTVVGSGSLITFPTLIALGFPPVVANVSNTIGLVPGSASGSYGYRRELNGQGKRIAQLGLSAAIGGLTGAILLLVLPSSAFGRVVPILILVACALVVGQPHLARIVAARRGENHGDQPGLRLLVALTAIYGGYFGAAQSVILIALLAIFVPDDMQRLNAVKNVLALIVNAAAAILFMLFAKVAWDVVALIAVGSIAGGQLGATIGRRLPGQALRATIVVVGLAVAAKLLLS